MKLYPRKASATNEELFIERYDRLLRWSLQLTEQDHELAEDLLHDAFIQFTLSPTGIDSINNLDGYLYGMLRNLHLSQVRRTTRHRFQQLSIVEYESALIGLRSVDPRTQIQIQQELRQICQYACARKETSKAGSVLILRFFHGYYPSEIVKILQSTRKAVDDRLRVARAEARVALESPEKWGFIGAKEIPQVLPTRFARDHQEFLSEVRQTIFNSRQHECLTREQLEAFYGRRTHASPTSDQLAHFVSCPKCLDEINKRLKLPLLAERFPFDTLGNEPRSKDGSGGGDSGGGGVSDTSRSVRGWKSDARDTFEHKPQELCISVNGYLQGSQKIASEVSEQSLTVDLAEQISFIEVFSEQGIRLLLMNIRDSPPEGPGEQTLRVPLSDGRTLDLALRFSSPWPTLDVRYHDPALAGAHSQTFNVQGPEEVESERVQADGQSRTAGPPASEGSSLISRAQASLASLVPKGRGFRLSTWDFRLLLRPETVAALFALVLVAVAMLVYRRTPAPPVSAGDLLTRAAAAEEAQLARTNQVLHRTISLEEKSSTGALIARRRIEIWQSGERGITARRLYDERGALVSGDWRRSDGVQTLYNHGTRPQLQLAPEKRGETTTRFDTVWQLGLAAKEFTALVGNIQSARVEESGANYVINYVSETAKTSGIVRARLVLSRADLHAIEQTLVVQQEGQAREYRFVETSFERRPPDSVAPAVFEPDAQLLTGDAGTRRTGETETITASPPLPVTASPAVATAALEVEVLRLLNQAGADLGEQINVTRAPDGRLHVQGVIETAQRKQEILAALQPVTGNPAVRIEVNTVAEAMRKQPQAPQLPMEVTVDDAQPTTNSIAVDADVRRYFSARGVLQTQMDDEVRRFANQIVSRSRQAMYHAAAMKRLAERFSPDEVRTLDEGARAKWLSLIRQHARTFQADCGALRQELTPVLGGAATGSNEANEIADTEALIRAVTHLFEVSAANYNAIQSAFTISNDASSATTVKSPRFWRAMRDAETLAGKIANSK
jgi:RNA polymerase sigma factor (sigma-70 family)